MINYFFVSAHGNEDQYNNSGFSKNFTNEEIKTLDNNIQKLNIKYKIENNPSHTDDDTIICIIYSFNCNCEGIEDFQKYYHDYCDVFIKSLNLNFEKSMRILEQLINLTINGEIVLVHEYIPYDKLYEIIYYYWTCIDNKVEKMFEYFSKFNNLALVIEKIKEFSQPIGEEPLEDDENYISYFVHGKFRRNTIYQLSYFLGKILIPEDEDFKIWFKNLNQLLDNNGNLLPLGELIISISKEYNDYNKENIDLIINKYQNEYIKTPTKVVEKFLNFLNIFKTNIEL